MLPILKMSYRYVVVSEFPFSDCLLKLNFIQLQRGTMSNLILVTVELKN